MYRRGRQCNDWQRNGIEVGAVEAALTSLLAKPLLRNDSGDGRMTIHAFALESM